MLPSCVKLFEMEQKMKVKLIPAAVALTAVFSLGACAANQAPAEQQTASSSSARSGAKAASGTICRAQGQMENRKGKDEVYLCSASAVLASDEARSVLDPQYRVSYGSIGSSRVYTSRQTANAVGKTADETCQRAFLNAVKRFESTASRLNSKNIRLSSYYDKKTLTGRDFECHVGTFHSKVVLRGSV